MPKLFLIRHGIAEDRDLFRQTGRPDEQRPLTSKGRERLKKIAKKLHQTEPKIDLFCQSPLTRSQQTVEIFATQFKKANVSTLQHLTPECSVRDLSRELTAFQGQTVALVGHEDQLSHFLAYLLGVDTDSPPFSFKKGGIACLRGERVQPAGFELVWMVTPRIFISDDF